MIAQRLQHQGHAPSPFRTVTGIWAPPFQPARLLLPLDVTHAFLNEHGDELYRATTPGVFAAGPNYAGADAGAGVQAADGRPLGEITRYGLPGDHPLIPVTWVRPNEAAPPLPRFERALPSERCESGVAVRMQFRQPVEGTLLGPARVEPYLACPVPLQVEAIRVRLPALPMGLDLRHQIGSAITCCCDGHVLVGLVVDFQPAGLRWDALCFPAYEL